MVSRREIEEEIRLAFKDVSLDGGVSLDQTVVMDDYGRGVTAEEFAALPLKEITNDWSAIPDSVLDEAECLAFLDDKGFKYYIPAFMIRLLSNYDACSMMTIGTIHRLYPDSEYIEERYALLNAKQRKAIALYVQSLPTLVDLDHGDATIINRAFVKYWSRYLDE